MYRNVRIGHLDFPICRSASAQDSFKKLLHTHCPISNPFDLQANRQCTTGTFPFESANFVRTDTLCQPYCSRHRDPFAQALVQKNLAPDAMRDRATQPAQWNRRIGQVTEPSLTLIVCQGNPRWRLESRRSGDCIVVLSFLEREGKDGREDL